MRCWFTLLAYFALCIYHVAQGRDVSYREDEHFLSWCAKFCESKNDEYLSRIYPTWRENADYVQEQNSLGLSYSLSLNKFAHLDHAEFSETNLQLVTLPQSDASFPTISTNTEGPPPPSVDWRKKGVVPGVQIQGKCGAAYAFHLVSAIECLHAIGTGELVLASVDEYINCCLNGTCVGAIYDNESYTCVVKNGGLAYRSEYFSPDRVCLNNVWPIAVKIDGGRFVTPAGNETELAYAVAMQPVVAAIDASHLSFKLYYDGIYYEPDCSSTQLDHAVLIVGYGTTDLGTDYWICQNCWGTHWGVDGYIYMARNSENNCGIATAASYPY